MKKRLPAAGISGYRYGEGCRGPGLWIGVTRYPPRAVGRGEFERRGYFQLRLPLLGPSAELVRAYFKEGLSFEKFSRRYLKEMAAPAARQMIELLAITARVTPVHVGCFCRDESRCHRSLLLELIEAAGMEMGGIARLDSGDARPGRFASPACSMPEVDD